MKRELIQAQATRYLRREGPLLLSISGMIGVVATAVLVAKAEPKAMKIREGMHNERVNDYRPEPTKTDYFKATWKVYIPPVLVGTATIACIFASSFLNQKRQVSIASAYGLLNETYKQYRSAAKEVYGEDADTKIQAQIAKDSYVHAEDILGSAYVYTPDLDPNSEKILCYDMIGQRYFRSTLAAILNAEYHLNRNLALRGTASANEFFEFLGIDKIESGDEIGWSMSRLTDDFGYFWLDFENTKAYPESGMECCVVSVGFGPELGFEDY